MGGGLLQHVNRDTQKFAMKCSAVQINNQWVDVMKDPITDKDKKSKAGLVKCWSDGIWFSSDVTPPEESGWVDILETVYLNGKLVRDMTFEEIRNNSNE